LIIANQNIAKDFTEKYLADFRTNTGHVERTDLQKHLVAELSLSDTLQYLLNRLKFTKETDSQTFSSLRGILSNYLKDNPDETCFVFLMSSDIQNNNIQQTIRKRRLNRNDEIQQLFQGEQPTKNGKYLKGEVYVGDRNIKDNDKVSIQIHRLNLTDTSGEDIYDEDGNQLYQDVLSLAIWIPENIGKDIIRQPENI